MRVLTDRSAAGFELWGQGCWAGGGNLASRVLDMRIPFSTVQSHLEQRILTPGAKCRIHTRGWAVT